MGKSEKKVKSDRINAIRKQYDAFLEDDKKRKERNEYILEKLDKMRYCTAVVQIRPKPIDFTEPPKDVTYYNIPKQTINNLSNFSHSDRSCLQLGNPQNRFEEQAFLQEISKKYILIPRIRQSVDNSYDHTPKPQPNDNADWKSKYDILEQLKRDEKEKDSSIHPEQILPEFHAEDIDPIISNENVNEDNNTPLLGYEDEIPEKLLPVEQTCEQFQSLVEPSYGYQADSANIENNLSEMHLNNIVYDQNNRNPENDQTYLEQEPHLTQNYIHNNINMCNNVNAQIDTNKQYMDTQGENSDNHEYGPNAKPDQQLHMDNLNFEHNILEPQAETDNNNIENDYRVPIESNGLDSSIRNETITNPHVDQEEIKNPIVNYSGNIDDLNIVDTLKHDHNAIIPETEYPLKTMNAQEYIPQDTIQIPDGVDSNPEPQVVDDKNDLTYHYDPAVDPVNVNNEQTEQGENYYNEQNENYDYTEEAVMENYSTEYPAPNENYQQNAEYGYYEGAQPEQPYEINENDEITQRFDQNYEQQYGTVYDQQAYEQQGYQQEYAQDYEQQGDYDTQSQQHYETQDQLELENQDNVTPQYVEQQLDNEQGYTEIQDTNTEMRNAETPTATEQALAAVDQQA